MNKFIRKIYSNEVDLIKKILLQNKFPIPPSLNSMIVEGMNDGQMGSLLFVHSNKKLGKSLDPYLFKDIDDIAVSATINLDTNGEIYELDIWKVNFSPLKIDIKTEKGQNNV